MNNKTIILLIALSLPGTMISMKAALQENRNASLLTSIPTEIQQIIFNLMSPPQWWYLQQTFDDNNKIHSMCFDPSVKLIAIGSECGTLFSIKTGNARILDIATGKEVSSFEHSHPVNSVCFDHSGKLLATASKDGKARIFDLQTNKKISLFPHNVSVFSVCFDHSEKLLATHAGDWITRIFDLQTNKEMSSFEYYHWINAIYFDLSGRLIATIASNKNIDIFDIQTKEDISSFEYHGWINTVCFDLSEKSIAIVSGNKNVHVFNTQTKEKNFSFTYDKYTEIRLASSEKLLAIALDDKKVRILARYDNYTIEQLILKNALLTWLLIEKPNKEINSLEKLIKDIASKFEISSDELLTTYATFPENMQKALLNTMLYKIQKHGKNKK